MKREICKNDGVEVHFYQGYSGQPKASVRIGKKEYVLELAEIQIRLEDMIEEKGYTISKTPRQKYPRLLINN
jgi:hypothetical protein